MSGASGLRKHGHTSAGDGGTITVPGGDAEDVTYDNSGSGLTATDLQAAIDELDATVDGLGGAGVEIDDDAALIQGVNFEDQGSDPSAPASGHTIIYAKGGGIYAEDDAAVVTGPFGTGGGAVATDTIFDAKGDLAVGTGSNTSAKLTVGANDTIPMADSGETTGIKWVASGTPTDQDYDDVAAVGTADTFSRGDHLHGMPASGGVGDILDLPTAETDDTLVLAPDGAGGVEFRAETGGSGNLAGTELDYVEFTSNVGCTATSEATANTIVTSSSVAYDGSTVVLIEFFAFGIFIPAGAARQFDAVLYDGSSSIGLFGSYINPDPSTGFQIPTLVARRLTPSNASHTYSIRGFVSGAFTGTVVVGSAGAGNKVPGFIRITRVSS